MFMTAKNKHRDAEGVGFTDDRGFSVHFDQQFGQIEQLPCSMMVLISITPHLLDMARLDEVDATDWFVDYLHHVTLLAVELIRVLLDALDLLIL